MLKGSAPEGSRGLVNVSCAFTKKAAKHTAAISRTRFGILAGLYGNMKINVLKLLKNIDQQLLKVMMQRQNYCQELEHLTIPML